MLFYVCKRIVNAYTRSIRIANADGQKKLKKLSLLKGDENFFPTKKSSEGVLYPSYSNTPCYARKTPPSSEQALNPPPLKGQELKQMFSELLRLQLALNRPRKLGTPLGN